MKLIQGMFADPSCRTFGLSYGQLRAAPLIRNAGWFNHLGERLGVGDLDIMDLTAIQADLEPEECFIVVDLNKSPAPSSCTNPGPDFVKNYGSWFVAQNELLMADDSVFDLYKSINGVGFCATARARILSILNCFSSNKITLAPPSRAPNTYYGLKLVHHNGENWAYGTSEELFQAAIRIVKEDVWAQDLKMLPRYNPLITLEDAEKLNYFADNYGKEANNIIMQLISSPGLKQWAQDYVRQEGLEIILAKVDGTLYNNVIPGVSAPYQYFKI